MTSKHVAIGNLVKLVFDDGEERTVARCATMESAFEAAKLLNKARILNDVKRQYTNAARTIAKAESLPGFVWSDDLTAL